MRFDTPIFFQTRTAVYNAQTANYEDPIVTEDKRYASVSSPNIEKLNTMFGEVKQGVVTIRIQVPYLKPFDYIRIPSGQFKGLYTAVQIKPLNNKRVFIVSEVKK